MLTSNLVHQTSSPMDPFSYLSVLISIILALGMTRVLAGVGEMLQARSHRRMYWVHALWIVNLFLYLVIAWWIFYRWRNQQPWTFFLFVFVLISPTILYLASMLLFPREGDVDLAVDYKTHYYANHRAFFILFALFTPVDIVDTLLKGIAHFLEQGWRYDISIAAALMGLTIAAITRNERYHQFYAIFFLIQTVIISFAIFHTLV
ncbi:MAG: hypothetical protein DME36_01345 [Verrucomicrobia bacterium]|nr:MAG: hypothetical protein DME36_01345 [Verrucomicrobiota bacterium]